MSSIYSSIYSHLMQEVETYGNGLLSEDTIERTVDILMECYPVPGSIDEIDIDSVIQAVEDCGAERLFDVYDLEYDHDASDWYAKFYAYHAYLHIGAVNPADAASYALRVFSDREWSITYILRYPGFIGRYSDMKDAVKRAYEHALHTGDIVTVLEVACMFNSQGDLEFQYIIKKII